MYQKTYIVDCLTKKQLVNHGKRNRYLVSNDHKPMISPIDLFFIDKAIKDEEHHIVELANLAMKSPQNRRNFEVAISDCTERIKVLRDRREEIVRQLNFNESAKAEIERIEKYLTEDRAVFTEFDDCTVRRLVNSISVSKNLELTIYLKGGYEIKAEYLPLKNIA